MGELISSLVGESINISECNGELVTGLGGESVHIT